MERAVQATSAQQLMASAGRTLFKPTEKAPIYKMLAGDNVIHCDADLTEGYLYLPSLMQASGEFYFIFSLESSVHNITVKVPELDNDIAILKSCDFVLLTCSGQGWFEVPVQFKGLGGGN